MKNLAGMHLLIDGYYFSNKNFDEYFVYKLFDELINLLEMTYLTKPIGIEVPLDKEKLETDQDEGGWSYYCQITTSHIALHTWPLKKAIMMDIFSCHSFDAEKALTLIKKRFELGLFESKLIRRDLPSPS